MRAAAPNQINRESEMAFAIEDSDIREKIYERKVGTTILFVVDASGSMGARKRMSAAKGAVISLLMDAYQKRDRVGLISFRGDRADMVLPFTGSVDIAKKKMDIMPTGGKTPLSQALLLAQQTFEKEIKMNNRNRMMMVLITDGKGNVPISSERPMTEAVRISGMIRDLKVSSLVLDTEEGLISLGLTRKLTNALGGRYMKLEEMESSYIAAAARKEIIDS